MIFAQILEIVALTEMTSVLCARKFLCIGLSALAEGPMDSRSFVRPSVCASDRGCVTPYLEIRASDFDDFLHKATS